MMLFLPDRKQSCSTLRAFARASVLAICGVLLLTAGAAAAGPTDVMLVLDNSGSMRQNDPAFLLKRAVNKFVSGLDQDTHLGVIIFDQNVAYPVPLAPLDGAARASIEQAMGKIDYRGKFTNIPAAIERAIYQLKTDARADAAKVVVFMTDGIVDTGNPAVDAEKANWLRGELAADAADNDIKVFGIAFTDKADFFLIQSLAKKTGGEYFRALTPEDLDGAFAKVQEKLAAPPALVEAAPAPVMPPPAPAAATNEPCLAGMVADERAALEQMATPDMPAEEMCLEMQQTPAGQAIVVRPGAKRAAQEDETLGLVMVLALAGVVLLLLAAIVVYFIRRRRPGVVLAPTPVSAASIPDAFIKDLHGISEQPALKIGAKPVMVGRVVGSDPDHLDYFVVDKGTIGRRHAIIKYRDFSFWLSDQGSVNGTFLNGERIDGERQLKHGDRIKFHKYEFEFTMPEMDNAGHTVFADPNDRTIIGEATMMGGTAAHEVFDLTRGAGDAGSTAHPEAFADDATTALSARRLAAEDTMVTAMPDAIDALALQPVTVGASTAARVARAEEEFDDEASAFFDQGEMSSTSAPAVDISLDDDFEDEPATAIISNSEGDDDFEFSESETLLPGAGIADALESSGDISLDEFMRTDYFNGPIPGTAADDEDATLLPDQVPPSLDDIIDITGERTWGPGTVTRDDDDEDEEPTLVNR